MLSSLQAGLSAAGLKQGLCRAAGSCGSHPRSVPCPLSASLLLAGGPGRSAPTPAPSAATTCTSPALSTRPTPQVHGGIDRVVRGGSRRGGEEGEGAALHLPPSRLQSLQCSAHQRRQPRCTAHSPNSHPPSCPCPLPLPAGDADHPGLSIAWGTCGHVFHLDCIQRWLKTRSACPLCNREWEFR